MATFISVLNSSMNLPYWEAVQNGSTLSSVMNNPYYKAGVNQNFLKHDGDEIVEHKQIKEVHTQTNANATVMKLSSTTSNYMKLANNSAPASFMKKLKL